MATTQIQGLLVDLAENVGTISKNERNQAQQFNFRGVDTVVKAVHPELVKLRLALTAEVLSYESVPGPPSSKGAPSRISIVRMRYTFTAPDGSSMSTEALGENLDYQDKGIAGAQSVALRVALLQLTTSPTDDRDPDQPKAEPEAPPQVTEAERHRRQINKAMTQLLEHVDGNKEVAAMAWAEARGSDLYTETPDEELTDQQIQNILNKAKLIASNTIVHEVAEEAP